MASELRVTTIANNAGTESVGSTYVINGSAKVWVNFNGTGTIATRESLNVSTLTDNGTGDYKVTFTSSLSTSDFGATASNGEGSTHGTRIMTINEQASSSQTIMSQTPSVYDDTTIVCLDVKGDLA